MAEPDDPRWNELAEHIAHRLKVGPGSRVSIFTNDTSVIPAAEALTAVALRRGAETQTLYRSEREDALELEHAPVDVIGRAPEVERAAMEWSTVHVSFRAMVWPAATPAKPGELPVRLAAQRKAKGQISTLRWQGTDWTVVRVPTRDWAAHTAASFDQLMDEFFAGSLDDWEKRKAQWAPLDSALDTAREVTITSRDTELRLGVAGRRSAMFAGEANLPDGELATAPVDDEVDGHITFPGTTVFAGQLIENLYLRFDRGAVAEVRADRGAAIARALIATDAGSRRVGELGIGVSPIVQSWTGDLFIDEKILGTVHIALGRAYPQCGGVNESTLHWDIVKDLRGAHCGSLRLDDRTVIDDGQVTWPGLKE